MHESQDYHDAGIVRQLIQHEDSVINTRFQWFATLQGLLFAAAAVIITNEKSMTVLIFCFSGIGILISTSTFYALKTATDTMISLTKTFHSKFPSYSGPPVIGFEASDWRYPLLRPTRALPLAMAMLWVAVLFMA